MKLFEEMPYLENELLVLREMAEADAAQLAKIADDPKVYIYLPTFLYEQKYPDKREAIARMRKECFETKESILLGVYLKSDPDTMIGIAEIYAYDEGKNKASIGCRLNREYWHKGIAIQVISLLMDYLDNVIKIRTITGHVMVHNIASAKSAEKAGLVKQYSDLWEDWGKEGPVLINKYVYKNPDHPKSAG